MIAHAITTSFLSIHDETNTLNPRKNIQQSAENKKAKSKQKQSIKGKIS